MEEEVEQDPEEVGCSVWDSHVNINTDMGANAFAFKCILNTFRKYLHLGFSYEKYLHLKKKNSNTFCKYNIFWK